MRSIRTAWVVSACVLSVACSSTQSEDRGPVPSRSIAKGCDPATECGGCGSCFDACLCGGGTSARCALECRTGSPAEASDAGRRTDSGTPESAGSLVSTLVPEEVDIPPGEEWFRCQNFDNPFGRDVAVLETESFMTQGSHHLFVFQDPSFREGGMEACSGIEFHPYLHLSQQSQQTLSNPPGVGRFFSRGDGLRIQIHFLNTSNETIHTEIAVTIRAAPAEDVSVHASQIFMNTLSISVPPHQSGSASHQCQMPKDVNVFTADSHMHQHGTHFVARADDGQLLYETTEWAEPVPWNFTPPRKLKAGTNIQVECDYVNTTDFPLSFGESAATNEMCIFAGSYYPAADGEAITCLF